MESLQESSYVYDYALLVTLDWKEHVEGLWRGHASFEKGKEVLGLVMVLPFSHI